MNLSEIRLLYVRELRSALRERAIVVNGILMPVFLYPVLLWVMFTGITFVQGLNEGFTSRLVVEGSLPPEHASLLDSLVARKDVVVLGREGDGNEDGGRPAASTGTADKNTAGAPLPVPADPLAALHAGDVDALVRFEAVAGSMDAAAAPAPADATTTAAPIPLAGNFRVHIRYDRSERRSQIARDRVEALVAAHRTRWLDARGAALGLDDVRRTLWAVASENVSSEKELGAMILGLMLPLFLVVMVALGCFMPSVDTTAGERERSTWETLLTVAASRSSVIMAKYLHVATLGILAGLLNVAAMFLSIGAVLQPLLRGDDALSFSIPPMAVPVMAVGAVVLALFFAAGMMILASFARTFKDGQAMVQPVYWLVLVPMLLGNQTDLTLTPALAAIPVANVTMMLRDALNGTFHWPLITLTVAVNLAVVALFLWIARRILAFEDFLIGSFDGSFWRFLKERIVGRKPQPGAEARSHA